ncbi:hypothetical protein BJX70DRAFT_380913 [Aspergillus crustosus]
MPEPIRVFLRFKADDVPGNPQGRHMTLSVRFFSEDLDRPFHDERDWIHVPANIDEQGAKCWMIMDLNAKEMNVDLDQIPIRTFRVQYIAGEPTFIHMNYSGIRPFSNMIEWGRREWN